MSGLLVDVKSLGKALVQSRATEELTRALRCATGQENGVHPHASSTLDACLYTQVRKTASTLWK